MSPSELYPLGHKHIPTRRLVRPFAPAKIFRGTPVAVCASVCASTYLPQWDRMSFKTYRESPAMTLQNMATSRQISKQV